MKVIGQGVMFSQWGLWDVTPCSGVETSNFLGNVVKFLLRI